MKTTGVVRRIDDLGRIVIPKEIRRTLRIHDGESLEIFVDNEIITLKKYSSLNELANVSKILVESINKEINKDIKKVPIKHNNEKETLKYKDNSQKEKDKNKNVVMKK